LISRNSGAAFPSGHAAFFFAFAAALAVGHPFLGIALLLSALAISLSRIIGGVHWPSDVSVGSVLGVVVGMGLPQVLLSI
jgi:undecaprenyl-diphosphatase